ncbi:hypothetical protein EVAR_29523_1 [Eumeta japonica]|uniref:Uncharacterized protein n=1 Tax=Eumeta variegata TaxID=151549 RepID=A0A4C1WGE4_EUMVA|nr:hypothetical protein EVAR_29523_1 [Eumeta japonica]
MQSLRRLDNLSASRRPSPPAARAALGDGGQSSLIVSNQVRTRRAQRASTTAVAGDAHFDVTLERFLIGVYWSLLLKNRFSYKAPVLPSLALTAAARFQPFCRVGEGGGDAPLLSSIVVVLNKSASLVERVPHRGRISIRNWPRTPRPRPPAYFSRYSPVSVAHSSVTPQSPSISSLLSLHHLTPSEILFLPKRPSPHWAIIMRLGDTLCPPRHFTWATSIIVLKGARLAGSGACGRRWPRWHRVGAPPLTPAAGIGCTGVADLCPS